MEKELKIYKALAKFASVCPPVPKDSENLRFSFKYASLSKIQEVVKKPLQESGLVLVHSVTMDSVTSTVYADDGSSVSSTFPFVVGKPQENGSAVTYAKRYNTAALLNLDTDADDDGNKAQENERQAVKEELPWLDKLVLESILRRISEGNFDGHNSQSVIKHIRTKYKVNKEQEAMIDKAVSLRVGNY